MNGRTKPTVLVDCGPTVREKSRSYAIGSPLPLLLRIRTDQSPEKSWSLSNGLLIN